MGKVVLVVGTPGAGKSSVLSGVAKDYTVVNMGTEMFDRAAKEYHIKNRDELREYHSKHIEKEVKLRKDVLRYVSGMDKNILFDTHMSVKLGSRFTPGFNMEDIKLLKGLVAIVYVDANADEIFRRRNEDLSRARGVEDEEDITNQREINLSLISTYAAILGIPVYIIKNNDGKLRESVAQMKHIAKEVFG